MSGIGSTNNADLRRAVLKQQNFVDKKEKDLKNLNQSYKLKEDKLAHQHRDRLRLEKEQFKDTKFHIIQDGKAKLSEIKHNNQEIRDRLEKEKKTISAHHRNEVALINANHQDHLLNESDKNHLSYQELITENNNQMEKFNDELLAKRQLASLDTSQKLNQIALTNNQLLQDENDQFKTIQGRNKSHFAQQLQLQKMGHKKTLNEQERGFHDRLTTDEDRFNKELEGQKKYYQNMIVQEKEQFENKYKQLRINQELALKEIQSNVKKQINAAKKSISEAKQFHSKREDDPFYSTTALQPQIYDMAEEKEYHLKIRLPEHEQDDVTIHGNGREIRLTLTRRMEQEIDHNSGEKDKTKRSELYVKTIPVVDIVTMKGLKQQYNDGMLTFFIKKA